MIGGAGVGGTGMRGGGAVATLGVEEEFLLVDAVSGRTAAKAGEVLARVGAYPYEGGAYQPELSRTQVEAATGVCRTLGELREQLSRARAALARACAAEGLSLVASGTPGPAGGEAVISRGERFERIARMYGDVVGDYQACACQVHVGVADRDTAVAVLNHLRPWLATLLALSANSPFDGGRDTGYASWRMVQQFRFPGSGVPPWFASAAAHDREVDRLVECGVLVDEAMTFWLARPSALYPTVEVRAADAVTTVDEAVLQAALSRGLVRTALNELAAGREGPRAGAQVCAAAVWSAARHGLHGSGVDVVAERRVPATRLLDDLVGWVTPALEESGDLVEVKGLLARAGSGAARQRQAASHGPRALLDLLSVSQEET
ncbi:YbdK family carboxylate-amine ligase [Nonomuraea phyllanthi]|uniref:Putative glutamate--cysteine ligase 2 n=1 Tax=Nonomuraea phyllanthi TaxID=2219224 RepID=A0A5C4WV49_9ACTN|nr:YbdK family carboxylate-amine ligase [Nonomuraea phyllanthi]